MGTAGSVILLEHGHFYDPALILYTRDLLKRTYLPSQFEALQWVQQRRDPETGERIKDPGVAPPTTVDLSLAPEKQKNNVYWATRATSELLPATRQMRESAAAFLRKLRAGVFHKVADSVKHYLWWPAAQDIFEHYFEQGQPKPQTLYCVMGHTHVPDTGETSVEGVLCIYFNSGAWTCAGEAPKDRSYATYLDLREDGRVWAQDWVWDRWEGE
jgi:UDP-2,3-diacylglucosamine pyrophosphatase LpxH